MTLAAGEQIGAFVKLERARSCKQTANVDYDAMAEALVAASSRLDLGGARTLLSGAMMSAAYLFQLSRPTPTLRTLYEEEPRWAHDALCFGDHLAEQLVPVARGVEVADAGPSVPGTKK